MFLQHLNYLNFFFRSEKYFVRTEKEILICFHSQKKYKTKAMFLSFPSNEVKPPFLCF